MAAQVDHNRAGQQQDVVFAGWHRLNFWEGNLCTVDVHVSHFSPEELAGYTVEWNISELGVAGSIPDVTVPTSDARKVGTVSFVVPSLSESVRARLHFRLKEPVAERADCTFPPQFTLTLYPGSVFFMPLSTNRLYTHDIRSSTLDARMLPTRLGYVVRCSSAEAVHRDGRTFLKKDGRLVKLEPPTPEGMNELRKLYAAENRTDAFIEYGDRFLFSMNTGDYLAPRI